MVVGLKFSKINFSCQIEFTFNINLSIAGLWEYLCYMLAGLKFCKSSCLLRLSFHLTWIHLEPAYEPFCRFLAKCKVKLKRQYLFIMLAGLKFCKSSCLVRLSFHLRWIHLEPAYEPVCRFLAKCKVKLKRQYLLYMLDGLKFSKRNLFSQIEFTINIIQLTYCKLNISKYWVYN